MIRIRLATIAALGTLVCLPVAAAAAAAPRIFSLADYIDAEPQLGVDARGGAVATWPQSHAVVGGTRLGDGRALIFASVRRPGHGFEPAVPIASTQLGVREYSLAVGAAGDGAVVWRPVRAGSPLLVNRRGAGGPFSAALALPGSRAGSHQAAAVDGHGRLLVAWLRRSGRAGCGLVVMASVAPRGGPLGRPRRISSGCARAEYLQAALARNGDGAVAWRASGPGGPVSASRIVLSTYSGGRFGAARSASASGNVGETLALAAGGRRLLVVWRDHAVAHRPARNRVLAAGIDGARIAPPVELVATPDALPRDVHASMNVHDAAIVAWQHSDDGSSVFDAFGHGDVAVRSTAGGAFGAPASIGASIEFASSYGISDVAIDASGRALACYDDSLAPRAPGGPWGAETHMRLPSDYRDPDWPPSAVGMSVGLSDAGEGVVAWALETSGDQEDFMRAAVIPAPR